MVQRLLVALGEAVLFVGGCVVVVVLAGASLWSVSYLFGGPEDDHIALRLLAMIILLAVLVGPLVLLRGLTDQRFWIPAFAWVGLLLAVILAFARPLQLAEYRPPPMTVYPDLTAGERALAQEIEARCVPGALGLVYAEPVKQGKSTRFEVQTALGATSGTLGRDLPEEIVTDPIDSQVCDQMAVYLSGDGFDVKRQGNESGELSITSELTGWVWDATSTRAGDRVLAVRAELLLGDERAPYLLAQEDHNVYVERDWWYTIKRFLRDWVGPLGLTAILAAALGYFWKRRYEAGPGAAPGGKLGESVAPAPFAPAGAPTAAAPPALLGQGDRRDRATSPSEVVAGWQQEPPRLPTRLFGSQTALDAQQKAIVVSSSADEALPREDAEDPWAIYRRPQSMRSDDKSAGN